MVESIQSYFTFQVAGEEFAANVSSVLEIVEVPNITKIPYSPPYMLGVIDLRGMALPVVDTRLKFGIGKTERTVNTCIIVLQVRGENGMMTMGALVDNVNEVMEIKSTDIQPAPTINSKYKPEFLDGMVKSSDRFILLLNIDKVFGQEVSILEALGNEVES